MKKTITILSVLLMGITSVNAQYSILATDNTGDSAGSNDGKKLEYKYDSASDSIWFRITNVNISTSQATNLGFNVMVNFTQGSLNTFNFWGADNTSPYNRLVTGWVTGTPPSNYTGTIGIADAAGVAANNYTNLFSNNLNIIVSTTSNTIEVGMNRSDLIPNSELNTTILVSAAVGTSTAWEDDVFSGQMNISGTTGINDMSKKSLFNIYPNPSNGILNVSTQVEIKVISIYSLAGKLIKTITTNFSKIDLSSEPKGIYFVNVQTQKGSTTEKIIIE